MKTRSFEEQPLTSDDTYERGPMPIAHECACQKSHTPRTAVPAGVIIDRIQVAMEPMAAIAEPMPAIAEPVIEANDSALSAVCLPWVTIAKNPERFRKCVEAARRFGQIDSPQQLYNFLCTFQREDGTRITSADQEVFWVVLFDTHMYVRGVGEITRGARDRVQVPIPDVIRLPVLDGATAFAIVHTHPSGSAKPSEADRQITKLIEKAGDTIGIPLFDHLVIGSGEFYSFDKKKLFKVKSEDSKMAAEV
jgi:hypothetical protein